MFNKILPNNTNHSFGWILWGCSSPKVLHDQGFNELKPQTYGSPFYLFVSWVEAGRWNCLIGVRNLNLPHLKAQREVSRNRIQLLSGSFYLHLHLGDIIWKWWGMKQLFTLIFFFQANSKYHTDPAKKCWNSPSCTVPQKLCLTRCHLTQQREELRLLQSLERRVSSITNYGYLDLPEAEGVLALLVFFFWRQLSSQPWWSKRVVWNGKSLEMFQNNWFFFFPLLFLTIF